MRRRREIPGEYKKGLILGFGVYEEGRGGVREV